MKKAISLIAALLVCAPAGAQEVTQSLCHWGAKSGEELRLQADFATDPITFTGRFFLGSGGVNHCDERGCFPTTDAQPLLLSGLIENRQYWYDDEDAVVYQGSLTAGGNPATVRIDTELGRAWLEITYPSGIRKYALEHFLGC